MPAFLYLIFASPNSTFCQVPCDQIPTPEYDGKMVTILDDKGNPVKDTIIERIPKSREIFSPCKDYVYRAIYRNAKGDLLSDEKIVVSSPGKRWIMEPEIQDEIIIKYNYTEATEKKLFKSSINPALKWRWTKEQKTGIIENDQKVWMHPFRSNQYIFTEIAPFPEVQLPLEIGKSWYVPLRIGTGWGVWENHLYYRSYKVSAIEDKMINKLKAVNCWKIESDSEGEAGRSTLIFWFHPSYGFVEMNYENPAGETLSLKVEEVIFKNK